MTRERSEEEIEGEPEARAALAAAEDDEDDVFEDALGGLTPEERRAARRERVAVRLAVEESEGRIRRAQEAAPVA